MNFNETFILMIKFISYKAIFILIVVEDWDLKQINIKIVFLYDNVEKKIYIKQFIEYISKKYLNKVCKLNKTLYDLKQFPRVWYNIFVEYIKEIGLVFIDVDFNVFINSNIKIIIVFYVNDVLIINSSRFEI